MEPKWTDDKVLPERLADLLCEMDSDESELEEMEVCVELSDEFESDYWKITFYMSMNDSFQIHGPYQVQKDEAQKI